MRAFLFPAAGIRWPFWLMALAWVCANSPQSACYEVIEWLGEARHFSHQARLTAGIKRALGVPSVSSTSERAITSAKEAPTSPANPFAPTDSAIKKIQLAAASERLELVLPRDEGAAFAPREASAWPTMPRDVPYPPPRILEA